MKTDPFFEALELEIQDILDAWWMSIGVHCKNEKVRKDVRDLIAIHSSRVDRICKQHDQVFNNNELINES